MPASIFVVSGPSGSGKTSLCKEMCQRVEATHLSVSTTTREKREGEEDGIDYFFVSREEFLKAIDENDFLEWAEVHGNFYGTRRSDVEKALAKGETVVFDIDVQGHKAIREIYPEITTSVFVTTRNMEVLVQRLKGRGTDSSEVIERRVLNALGEMKQIKEYDYLIVNETFDESLDSLIAIGKASRFKRAMTDQETFIQQWKTQKE